MAPLKRQAFIPHLTCSLREEIIEALISARHAKNFKDIDHLQGLLGVIGPLQHVRRKLEDRVAPESVTHPKSQICLGSGSRREEFIHRW